MPKVLVDPKAQKRFNKFPEQEKQKIVRAIKFLELDQIESLNITRLKLPKAKMFRIRVGNIRIIYELLESTIYISVIDFRSNVY